VIPDLVVDRDQRGIGNDLVVDRGPELIHRIHDAFERAVVIDPSDVEALLILLAHLLARRIQQLLKLGDSLF
jgi:hypothetical protein